MYCSEHHNLLLSIHLEVHKEHGTGLYACDVPGDLIREQRLSPPRDYLDVLDNTAICWVERMSLLLTNMKDV